MTRYNVPIVYTGLSNFIVEADTPDEAKVKAEAMFKNGETPDLLGNESEEIDAIHDPEIVPPDESH